MKNKINERYKEVDEFDNIANEIINFTVEKNYPIVNRINKRKSKEYFFNFDSFKLNEAISNANNYKYLKILINSDLYIQFKDNIQTSYFKPTILGIIIKYPNEDFKSLLDYYIEGAKKDPDDDSINIDDAKKILRNTIAITYRKTLVHELKHAYDYIRTDGLYKKNKRVFDYYNTHDLYDPNDINSEMSDQHYLDYLNLPHEFWARFTEFLVDEKWLHKKSFEDALKKMKTSKTINYDKLTDDRDKKNLIKALYKHWHIKNKK